MASVSRLRRRAKGCENYNVRIGVFRKSAAYLDAVSVKPVRPPR